MTTPLSSLALAQRLADHLFHFPLPPQAVPNAMKALEIRRTKRREQARKNNAYEYVVECLLRPVITAWTVDALGIRPEDGPRLVNSSHYHSTDDPRWPESWTEFKRLHPHVDIDDSDGHGRRADLFVVMPDGGLVSIDFKYVPPRHTPSVAACVRQLGLCLEQHEASILVLYAGRDPSKRLGDAAAEILKRVKSEQAFVVWIVGPAIDFSTKAREPPARRDGEQS